MVEVGVTVPKRGRRANVDMKNNMIPKRAIEKAIEGGWSVGNEDDFVTLRWEIWALDPTFWQSLGKALGWVDGDIELPFDWHFQSKLSAHKFYEIILTGGDVERFWTELLNEKVS